jgi:hypothetical protein
VTDVPFRIEVYETAEEWLLIGTSPLGREMRRVPTPFAADELRDLLAGVEKALIRSVSPVITRRAAPPERVTREFGERLSETLLGGELRILYDRSRERAREQRANLRILIDPDGPNVSRIPWEFTVDPNARDDYLALRVPIARSPHLLQALAPLEVEPPLRVLGVMSRPSDLPPLEVERERRQVSAALQQLSSDLVQVEWLPGDRWQQLASAVRGAPWHILHFVGHGGFDEETESGYLELSGEDGTAINVPATDLSRLVAENRELRLVVLNACESAATGSHGTMSSTAAKLIRDGVPAVVAMQYEITDPAALAFACSFYEAIARGVPVDRAVTLARESVKMTFRSLEWATPVLFLASEETRVFAVPRRPEPLPGGGPQDWSTQVMGRLNRFFNRGSPDADLAPGPALGPVEAQALPPVPPPVQAPVPPVAQPRPVEPVRPTPALSRLQAFPAPAPCSHQAIGPGDLVALACTDGAVRVLSPATGRQVAQCRLRSGQRPRRLAWSPWKRHLASQHDDGAVVVWDLETEVAVHVLRPPGSQLGPIAFSGNGRWLAIAGSDRRVHVLGAAGQEVRTITVPHGKEVRGDWRDTVPSLTALLFAPGDRQLLVAGDDGVVREFDVRGEQRRMWPHPEAVTALALADDRIVTGSTDGRVRSWSWEGRLLHRREHGAALDQLAVAADGQVAAGSGDGVCRLSDREGRAIGTASLTGRPVGLGFMVRTRALVTATDAGLTETWSLEPMPASREGD